MRIKKMEYEEFDSRLDDYFVGNLMNAGAELVHTELWGG